MAEPITASALVSTIAFSAAENIGNRIGEEIGNGIFGRSDDMDEIRTMFSQLNAKVDEILQYCRLTYNLLSTLPDLIIRIIEAEKLYHAHNTILSNYETYVRLPRWNRTIGHDTASNLLSGWHVIIDAEGSTEQLAKLPKYGEFLLLVTNGKLHDIVESGVCIKLDLLISLITVEKDKLLSMSNEVENLLKSNYVETGTLLNEKPWATWKMKPERTITVRTCDLIEGGRFGTGPLRCYNVQVPDSGWNNQLNTINAKIGNEVNLIDSSITRINSLIVLFEILNRYKESLISRRDCAKEDHNVSVIDSRFAFPEI